MKNKELKIRYREIKNRYIYHCKGLVEELTDHIERVQKGAIPDCPLDYMNVSYILEAHGALREIDDIIDNPKPIKKITKAKKVKPETNSPLKKAYDTLLPKKKSSLEGWSDVIKGIREEDK